MVSVKVSSKQSTKYKANLLSTTEMHHYYLFTVVLSDYNNSLKLLRRRGLFFCAGVALSQGVLAWEICSPIILMAFIM